MTESATQPGVDDGEGKRTIDWEAIERDYRAGVLSLRELGDRHGISHVAIVRKAKREGWERDLTRKVQDRVRTALVTMDGNSGSRGNHRAGTDRLKEAEIVDGAAHTVIDVVRSHRATIRSAQAVTVLLLRQLTDAAEYRETLRDMIEEETSGDKNPNRRVAMLKAVSIPAHAGTVRDLAQAMSKLVVLERQAFNIDQTPDPDPPPVEADKPIEESDPALHVLFVKLATITGKGMPEVEPTGEAPKA